MNEREEMIENYKKHIKEQQEKELRDHSKIIENFLDYCNKKSITLTLGNISYIQTIGIIATFPNIVNLLNTSIIMDKEELFDFDMLEKQYKVNKLFPGYFISENYMIMANPYFRRGHYANNNFCPGFIEMFWPFSIPENEKYISLDLNRVRINVDNRKYTEHDSWFGASFNKNIGDIKEEIIKLRPPLELDDLEIDFFFGGTYSLDIKWSSYDKIKVFQLEEFKTHDLKIIKNGTEYFPVRYIHAEYDITTQSFRHFDGAIHFYTQEEYLLRRDQDFNFNNKNKLQLKTLSQKLFKINGAITVENWTKLVSSYLSGNPLIFEYFEGQPPPHIQELLKKIRK